MHFPVCLPFLVALAVASPVTTDTICAAQLEPIAYATHDISKLQTEFPAPSSGSSSSTSFADDIANIEYEFPAPISAPPLVPVAAPARITYGQLSRTKQAQVENDFPAPISAPAPVSYAIRQPVQIANPVPVPHAYDTRTHYAENPVVVGQSAHIMKPNFGAGAVTDYEFMGLAQTKTAGQKSYAQKSKVLAPARSVSEVTPHVAVQHPTKVNVQKVAVEVPVAAPYAQPVPVPRAPQYDIHQYHQPRYYLAAFPPVRVANADRFTRQRNDFLLAPESPRYFRRLLPGNAFTNFSQLSQSAEDRDSHETYDD